MKALRRNSFRMAVLAGLGMAGLASPAVAMNMHVNGNQLVLEGTVTANDAYLIADFLNRLASQGKQVTTLVLRNSDGGAVSSGYAIGDIARRYKLTTVASGFCISSCSAMFVGGTKRAFAASDQPFMLSANLDQGTGQFIGIHGVTGADGGYANAKTQSNWKNYFLTALTADGGKTDTTLIDDALSNHGAAFARLWDSAAGRDPSVYWCYSDCSNPAQYKAYPTDTALSTSFVTQDQGIATNDTLVVSQDVAGNINPNYFNIDAPGAKNPITALTNALSYWDYSWYGGGAFAQSSQPDIYLQDWQSETPAKRIAELDGFITEAFQENFTAAQYQAMLADPNSLLNQQLAAVAKYAGQSSFVDESAYSIGDAYGVVSVTNGATWTLKAGDHGDADTIMVQQGRILLNGGTLNAYQNYIGTGGMLEGSGFISQMGSQNSDQPELWFRAGGVLHPTGNGIEMAGLTGDANGQGAGTSFLDFDDAAISLDVTAGQTRAPLRIESAMVTDSDWKSFYIYYGGRINVTPNTVLALNVAPGFYGTGSAMPLIAPDLSAWLAWAKVNDQANYKLISPALLANFMKFMGQQVYISSPIMQLARADASGNPISGYVVDPTDTDAAKSAFHPFDDSLVSFHLQQNGNSVVLITDNAFAGNSLFCNTRDCALGNLLSNASLQQSSPLQPLVGALEFSSTQQAAKAVGEIEGAGYAQRRMAEVDLIDSFATTLSSHLMTSDIAGDKDIASVQAAMPTMLASSAGRDWDASSLLRYFVANNDALLGQNEAPNTDTSFWGKAMGHHGHFDGSDALASTSYHSAGLMLGVDHRSSAQLVWGGSLSYGALSTHGGAFEGQTHAFDARFYLRYDTEFQYFDGFAGLTHLSNKATRHIDLRDSQLAFYSRNTSRDSGTALSLHLEHGWTYENASDWLWQPILPAVDIVRLPSLSVSEGGSDPALALRVHAGQLVDTRVSGGLRLSKHFVTYSGTDFVPHAQIALAHEFRSGGHGLDTQFASMPNSDSFQVEQPRNGNNHAQADLGVDAYRNEQWAFTFDYVGDVAAHGHDQGLALGAKYLF